MPIQLISLGSAPDDGTGTSLHAGGAIINENFLLLRDMISGVISGFDLQGGWDASTNTPALESGVGTTGHAYMVTVAGGTELDGVSDWQVGESLVFAGDAWVRTLTVGIPVSEKGAANGVPTLDAGAVVPLAQVPTIPVAKGGTGRATLTTGSYLRGAGTGEVALRTAAETLEDIGAALASAVVNLVGVQSITGVKTFTVEVIANTQIRTTPGANLGTTGTLNLDMAGATLRSTGVLTGNIVLTANARLAGRSVTLRILNGATERTLSFPAGWKFVGAKPESIAVSKVGILTLTAFGTTEADIVAAYAEEE